MSSVAPSASSSGYTLAQRAFHWLMAALIIIALALGVAASQLPRGDLRGDILFVHKSLGVTVLALVALRIIVRWIDGRPAYREPLDPAHAVLSRAAHTLLYAVMVLLPLSGYVMSSAARREIPFFGLFTLPGLAPHDRELARGAASAHFVLACGMGVLLALHVAAAIWHAAVKRDEVMARMWPISMG